MQSPSEDKAKRQNIGSSFDCGGGLLTLSIHAVEADKVKAYLYWNGKVMRFMPQDIKDVFPVIFNMEHKGNRKFIKDDSAGYVEQLETLMVDSEFERFRSDL